MGTGLKLTPWLGALALVAACQVNASTTVSPDPDGGALAEVDAGDADGGAAVEGGSSTTPSCDPYQARAKTPRLLIGPTGLQAALVADIDAATTSIDVLIYELGTKAILDAFAAAVKRGVAVRVIVDRKSGTFAKAPLTAGGAQVKDSSPDFYYAHAKAMVIDHARAWVMSANMNDYSMQGERNYGVVLEDADDVASLQSVFDHDWAGGGTAGLDLSCSRLLVSPVNARARLTELVTRAASSLDLAVMYVTDPKVYDAVVARAGAGVAVRVLLADPAWITNNAQTAASLKAAGVPVRYFNKYDLHAKLVLTDVAAFVGSENFSTGSLDTNREVGVLVTDKEPLAAIRTQFEADWALGIAP